MPADPSFMLVRKRNKTLTDNDVHRPPSSLIPIPPSSSVFSMNASCSASEGREVLSVCPSLAASRTAMLTPEPLSGLKSEYLQEDPPYQE